MENVRSGRNTDTPPGILALVRNSEVGWSATPFEGITLKVLYSDTATGMQTALVRMEAGAKYPSHRHAAPEHCYVVQGDLVFHDHVLRAGDYEVAAPSTDHSIITTLNGCLLFITNSLNDRILA